MLIFAAVGMAGFLLLLILWLWILPDREQGAGWWTPFALFLTTAGAAGTVASIHGIVAAGCAAAAVGGIVTVLFGRGKKPRDSRP